jgi:hypothetical protein
VPLLERDDASGSGYVSEEADGMQRPGESYVEESDASGTEQYHRDVPDEGAEAQQGPSYTTEAMKSDFEESLPHTSQFLTPQAGPEPSNLPDQEHEEPEGPEEEEREAHSPTQEPEHLAGFKLGTKLDATASQGGFDHGYDEGVEQEYAVHEPLQAQPESYTETGKVTPEFLQAGDENKVDDGENNAPHSQQRNLHDDSPSPEEYRGYGSSPEPSNEKYGDSRHEIQRHNQASRATHVTSQDVSEDEYHTDTDSQRFVTPLPSHHSLRALSQHQGSFPFTVGPDDYAEGQDYPGDDTRQYELEHQHTTTVHGEDDLFDDTDRSEDHSVRDTAVAEHASPPQQGTAVWRPSPGHLGQSEEMHPDSHREEQKHPQLTAGSSVAQDNSAVPARSWAEEADSYFEEEEETRERPETPPARQKETRPAPEAKDASRIEAAQESPADTGLATGRRSPGRPETPTEYESLGSSEYVTPEKALPARDVTRAPWRADDGWTPQSLRTQTTNSSPPTSPPHPSSAVKHKPPVVRSDAATETPSRSSRQRAEHDHPRDDTEAKTPVNLMAPWQGHESPEPEPADNRHSTTSEGNTGSLFRRMRSIFEQPHPSISSTHDSHQPSPSIASDHPPQDSERRSSPLPRGN